MKIKPHLIWLCLVILSIATIGYLIFTAWYSSKHINETNDGFVPGNGVENSGENKTLPEKYDLSAVDLTEIEEYHPVELRMLVGDPLALHLWHEHLELAEDRPVVLRRSLMCDGQQYYYGFLADSLEPLLVTGCIVERHMFAVDFGDTVYDRLLHTAELKTIGSDKADNSKEFYLTVDFCQSVSPWDAEIFEILEELYEYTGRPQPVALCMTYLWMERFPKETAVLKDLQSEGILDITWVNHSMTHPVADNFLANPAVDFEAEVLEMEQYLLKSRIAFSPFFRFPGLIYNDRRLEELRSLGLINLGASAWLAKGEDAFDGSIILIHGNGNEPYGIKLFRELYENNRDKFLGSKWKFTSLSDLPY